jgi:glycosyltransferase involved in cell wall biosynthesis
MLRALRYAPLMLTVLIETLNEEERLATTLGSLVGGAVDGVIREVLVCDRGSSDQTGLVADHAGCIWLERSDLAAGVSRARGEWLLILEPGATLRPGWTEPVLRHASEREGPARFTRAAGSGQGWLARLLAPRALSRGLLIYKPQARALISGGGIRVPRLGTRRLAAEIVSAR